MGFRSKRTPISDERAADPQAARAAALALLERTRRTRRDLATRLRDKGYRPDVVEQVLERLTEVGLVNDAEYARAFLTGRWGRRAAGWRMLELQLRGKGVSAEDIANARGALESEVGPVGESAGARRVIEQAQRRLAKLEPRERRRRLWALLSRRGFDGDTIAEVLAESERQ